MRPGRHSFESCTRVPDYCECVDGRDLDTVGILYGFSLASLILALGALRPNDHQATASRGSMRILSLLRGVVATALTWAVIWVPFSLIIFGLTSLSGGEVSLRVLGTLVAGQALTGAINGAVFAGLLAAAGRRRSFESLSMRWFAGLGAIGGALFPFAMRATLLSTVDVSIPASVWVSGLVTTALLGAGCASLTLSIARRATALPTSDHADAPAVSAGAA
jgi:hypothetical protein